MSGIRAVTDVNYTVYIDEASSTVTYVGKALPGSSETNNVWQIQKIEVVSTVTKITWADGNKDFDNIWSLRSSLVYI
jgi:hypothetical protein